MAEPSQLVRQPSRLRDLIKILEARARRRVLVDQARCLIAQTGVVSEKFSEALAKLKLRPEQILRLDDALTRLERVSPRQVCVAELRFLGGLAANEVAKILGINERTVKRDYSIALAWLVNEVKEGDDPESSVTLNT